MAVDLKRLGWRSEEHQVLMEQNQIFHHSGINRLPGNPSHAFKNGNEPELQPEMQFRITANGLAELF